MKLRWFGRFALFLFLLKGQHLEADQLLHIGDGEGRLIEYGAKLLQAHCRNRDHLETSLTFFSCPDPGHPAGRDVEPNTLQISQFIHIPKHA